MVEYIINHAIECNEKIKIIYRTDREITVRMLKPFKTINGFLEAYCFKRKALRKFKIENILSAELVISRKRAG